MSIHRFRFLCGLAAVLLTASVCQAQVRIPTENTLEDMQLFAPVDSNAMSDRPYLKEGLFFSHDYLVWSVQRPRVAILGDPGRTRLVFDSNTFRNFVETNSLDTGLFHDQLHDGNRTEIGYIYDCGGWMLGYTSLHERTQEFVARNAPIIFNDPQGITNNSFIIINGFDADLDGDRVYGRDGEDLGTPVNVAPFPTPHPQPGQPAFVGAPGTVGRPEHPPGSLGDGIRPGFYLPYDGVPDSFPNGTVPDFGDLVPALIDFEDIEVQRFTDYWSVEAMMLRRLNRISFKGHWELMCGVRYVNWEEQFHVEASGGILSESHWNNESWNRIVGPQIGARWFRDCCRWRFAAEGRFAPSVNFQTVHLYSSLADTVRQGLVATPQQASALPFQNAGIDTLHAYDFSPVAEFRLNWTYQLTRAIAVGGGYTATYVGQLARPSNMIEYRIPNLRLIREDYHDDTFMQGLNFRVEVNR
jgi:hypothetical protein